VDPNRRNIEVTNRELAILTKALRFICNKMEDDMAFENEFGVMRHDAEDLYEALSKELRQ
jgi:hypothetical protein